MRSKERLRTVPPSIDHESSTIEEPVPLAVPVIRLDAESESPSARLESTMIGAAESSVKLTTWPAFSLPAASLAKIVTECGPSAS